MVEAWEEQKEQENISISWWKWKIYAIFCIAPMLKKVDYDLFILFYFHIWNIGTDVSQIWRVFILVCGFSSQNSMFGFSQLWWSRVFECICIFICSLSWNYCGLLCKILEIYTEIQLIHFRRLNLSNWNYMNLQNRESQTFCIKIISKYNGMYDYSLDLITSLVLVT